MRMIERGGGKFKVFWFFFLIVFLGCVRRGRMGGVVGMIYVKEMELL